MKINFKSQTGKKFEEVIKFKDLIKFLIGFVNSIKDLIEEK
jgi:hypothetical protein